MREVGKNIRQLRMEQGMSQEDLAKSLFVSRQTVSNYENGKSSPDLDMLVKVAEVLGVDENSLLHGGEEVVIDKKKVLYAVLELTGIVLLLIGLHVSMEKVEAFRQRYYSSSLSWLMMGYIRPLIYLIGGWLGMDALNHLVPLSLPDSKWSSEQARPKIRIWRVYLIIFVIAFMANQLEITAKALYFDCQTILTDNISSYAYSANALFGEHLGMFLIQTVARKWFGIFGVIGALLWLTRKSKNKKIELGQ